MIKIRSLPTIPLSNIGILVLLCFECPCATFDRFRAASRTPWLCLVERH